MAGETEYPFVHSSRIAIVQARHETLFLGGRVVAPRHLVLGVLKTLPAPEFEALFPGAEAFERLCAELGADTRPAPLIAEEVSYHQAAQEALAGAIRAAASDPRGPEILPIHLLIGVLRPCGVSDGVPTPSGAAADALVTAGIDLARLEGLLSLRPEHGTA
ncbi:MAG TPA: hypothetical protein VLD58_00970 [Gemmatimonadales bacterium]|nr:hypothetical protein [Gemmatimonadales bacterium]